MKAKEYEFFSPSSFLSRVSQRSYGKLSTVLQLIEREQRECVDDEHSLHNEMFHPPQDSDKDHRASSNNYVEVALTASLSRHYLVWIDCAASPS